MRMAPLVMVVMSIVYAVTSYPAGAAADRGQGARLLSFGLVALVAADLVLAHARRPADGARPAPRCGDCTWASRRACCRRSSRRRRRRTCAERRSASSISCAASRCSSRSGLAGWLWDAFGPRFTFYAGAAFTVIAWVGFLRYGREAAALPAK